MNLRAFRFQLPLSKPVTLAGKAISHREGLLLQDQNGRWSEASPLPGFSRESLVDVIADLQAGKCETPSLRFAIDSLKLSQECISVDVNALLQGNGEEVAEAAKKLSPTCSTVKLKVSDPDLVHAVRDLFGGEIRLDANRRWNYSRACQFLRSVRSSRIEYIEEPIDDPTRLEELYAETGVPYALDETLAEGRSLDLFPNAAAFVVKPTILGGLDRIKELAAYGKPIVFSAAYEAGIGIAQIARLAARFSPGIPAGLDTYSRLGDDVLSERLDMTNWKLAVPSELRARTELLEEIEF